MLSKLIIVAAIIFILTSAFVFFMHKNMVNEAKPIVFFGDSITAGQGAGAGEDFPNLIGKTLNVPIVNSGIRGNTKQDALLRINNDVLSKNPSIVVIELGSNDLLEHISAEETKRNFDLILAKVKPTGAKIVILGVKFFLSQENYETDWSDLAKKYNAIFIPNILDGVITVPSLKFDDIHPNARGYQKIANKLIPIITPLTLQKPNSLE